MRTVIVSDIHLGDEMCSLINFETMAPEKNYEAFKEKAGVDNDYLILLGDIIDLSITEYDHAFEVAKAFFQLIQKDGIAKSIIYVPGNHDFDLWHTVEHQISIIHQIAKGRPPRSFRWSVPGLIDDRTDSPTRGFHLPGVTTLIDPDHFDGTPMFLNAITKNPDGSGKPTYFYFAYPNLYFVTNTESVLITHGHYLEAYWTLVSDWALKIAQGYLGIGDALDVRELAAINSPLCQLACTGVGQAGPLTQLVRDIQREVKEQNLGRVKKILDRLDDEIDKLTAYGKLDPREWGTDLVSNYVKGKILEALGKMKDTRFSEEFMSKPEVLDRFRTYFAATGVEIDDLNQRYHLSIPKPRKVIFGHTHQPFGWGSEAAPKAAVAGGSVRLYNTGGWLLHQHKGKELCGAAVFVYDSATGFTSYLVT